MKYFVVLLLQKNGKFLMKRKDGKFEFPMKEYSPKNNLLLFTALRALSKDIGVNVKDVVFLTRLIENNKIINVYFVPRFFGKLSKKFVWIEREKAFKTSSFSKKLHKTLRSLKFFN